jgi:hypothetical protein
MLVDIPKFQKRIKERILWALHIPKKTLQLGDGSKKEYAGLQTLNVISLPSKPSMEDREFRENLANYFYCDETPEGLSIDGVPYLCVHPYEPKRTGPIESAYPILEGPFDELIQYVRKETENSSLAIQNPNHAQTENNARLVAPPAALHIQIPWHTKGDTIQNLPNPEQTVAACEQLTHNSKSQLTLLVAGPKNSVEEYCKNLNTELSKKSLRQTPIGTVVVKNSYVTSQTEAKKEDWEVFEETQKSRKNQKNLKKTLQLALDHCESYIDALATIMTVRRERENAKKSGTFYNPSEELAEGVIQTKVEFEKWTTELRRGSGAWLWRNQTPLHTREQRTRLSAREDQLEKNISAYSKALQKNTETPKTSQNLRETRQALLVEAQEITQGWFDLQEEILHYMEERSQGFQNHPWKLHVLHFRSSHGFQTNLSWEPFQIEKESWDTTDLTELEGLLKNQTVDETHLAQCSAQWGRNGKLSVEVAYPNQRAKILSNPGVFHPPSKALLGQRALDALTSPAPTLPLKLDIRLKPCPEENTELLLENDNLQIELYNPVSGRPTGLKDATLWRPIFTKKGLPHVENALKPFGYQLEAGEEIHNYVEKKVKQSEKFLSPNYPLTPYESLAYYENGARRAEKTIFHPDTQEPLWIEGKSYHITPSWKRQTLLVDHSVEEETQSPELQEEIQRAEAQDIITIGKTSSLNNIANSTRIKTLTERRINFGFSTFIVEAENNKTYEIQETVSKDTLAMEKERIALEIDHTLSRIEEIQRKEKRTKTEENELRKLNQRLAEKTQELDHWAPMIEDFMEAFPPEAPALSSEIHKEEISQAAKKIYARFAPFIKENPTDPHTSLKDYQLQWAALGSIKRSHCNSSSPGAGKTLMAIMASWQMGHHYNWVICPTIAMKTWAKELERVGLHHEIVGYKKDPKGGWAERPNVYQHMRELTQRFHKRTRTPNRLGKIEPEFYIVSAENVALGGEGNKTYSPWHFDYTIQKRDKFLATLKSKNLSLPAHWSSWTDERGLMVRVWSDRPDNSKEITKSGLREFLKPLKFRKAVTECPRCQSNGQNWTKNGHCKVCGHHHSAITKVRSQWNAKKHHPKIAHSFQHMTCSPPKDTHWEGDKTSHKQYPLYKMMGKHVGCKIIDEVHNWSNFHSQHGAALLQVRSKDTIILSGTLCKTHISELEPSLCQIYEANSGEFPYSPWGMDLFREQFETLEIENTFQTSQRLDDLEIRRRSTSKVVPEASNLTKLRALLHGVLCSVGENEMERVWDLLPIRENIRYVELQRDNAEIYQNWERLLKEAYSECKTEHERIGMLRRARSQMTNLAYACDGPEKLEAAIAWIQEGMERNQRSVIVGPSTRFHKMLGQALKERGIPFASMGSLNPDKRFEFLNKFRDSDCPNLLSRIRLINVNFNQLTCCTRILFTGIDPSPAAIRQMQKRLNRIGQTQPVDCTFLISQLPPTNRSRETLDVLEEIQAQTNPNYTPNPTTASSDNRPPSYEERLFALVLRRENAIKQTLQQADRQRDPQELYEMLKDRQTLNQVLKDIVEDAKSDDGVSDLIKRMAETGLEGDLITKEEKNPETTQKTTKTTKTTNTTNTTPETQPPKKRRKSPSTPRRFEKSSPRNSKPENPTPENPTPENCPSESCTTPPLEHVPKSSEERPSFGWKPVKPLATTLQGEFF